MPTDASDACPKALSRSEIQYRREDRHYRSVAEELALKWNYRDTSPAPKNRCLAEWFSHVRSRYDVDQRVGRVFSWTHRKKTAQAIPAEALGERVKASALREQAESLRPEFTALAEEWRRDTRFSSSLDDKVLHRAYQSIIAMGKPGVPLVLEELEARRGHWFWALHFMTKGVDPIPEDGNVEVARTAWLEWGRREGLLK